MSGAGSVAAAGWSVSVVVSDLLMRMEIGAGPGRAKRAVPLVA